MTELSAATKAKYSKPNIYRGFIARFPRAIEEIARVSEYGTVKHERPLDDVSYTDIPDAKYVFVEAECRHLIKEAKSGPVNYEDNGMLHKAQKAWDSLADLEIFLKNREERANSLNAADMAARAGAGHPTQGATVGKYEDLVYTEKALAPSSFPHRSGFDLAYLKDVDEETS